MENSNVANSKQALIEARRTYQKQWRKKNPDKVKATQERFYLKQIQKAQTNAQN